MGIRSHAHSSGQWPNTLDLLRTMRHIIVFLWLAGAAAVVTASFDINHCRLSLGMQSGEIPDYALTSSSSYDPDSVGPSNARIRTESNGGAWCPGQPVSEDVYEYLQVDLQTLMVITLVETQGRFGNGQGQEFADQYLLEYQREEDGEWFRFHNRRSQEVFQGNTNTYIAELREVDPPIIARRIRFIPYSIHPRTVCLRVEIYGCIWKDGTVAYSMDQGERRGTEVDLYDFTYDGDISDFRLSNGMGQLTDGILGETNFRLDPKGFGNKGYEWVGWRNESRNGKPTEITFRFDAVRNFTALRIHCNNMFSKDVRVFKSITVSFSIGGEFYTGEPIFFEYMRDTLIEYARHVTIPLHNHIGRFVKLELAFDSKWLMISEVTFESDYGVGNFSVEVPPTTPTTPKATSHHLSTTDNPNVVQVIDLLPESKKNNSQGPKKVPPTYDADNSLPKVIPSTTVGHYNSSHEKTLNEEYIGIIIGALAALILLLFVVIVIIIIRHRRSKYNNNHHTLKTSIVPRHVTLDLNDLQANALNEATLSRDYAVPDITKSSFGTLRPNIPPPVYTPNIYGQSGVPVPPESTHYAASDIVNIPNIQGVAGSNVYAVPNPDLLWTEDLAIMEFPPENLKFIEKLGEGQFGEVHLCEAQRMTDFLGDDFLINRTSSPNMLVAVKMLRRNADQPARVDFQKEVKIMSRIKDPNIVQVLGVCTREDPLSVVVEYMKYGDLHQFLEQHVAENTTPKKKQTKQLSRGCLIYMATQIASGMKYLESLSMVHRDLATRNCLVGHHYCIKISDFGMSRSLYSCDYYRIEGQAVLPIRWMAWESILLGKFCCKTDVWSFGVTLWEILTLAREQPFENCTDEQVIENCGHYYRDDGLEAYLPQPATCPREIYDLMKECWNRQESQRPTFREIHMFLQRKNMGYDPVLELGVWNKGLNVPIV